MKSFFLSVLIFIFFIFPLCMSGQNTGECIRLHNGQVLYGNIIEIQPYLSVKIQTADGKVTTLQMSEIEKISYNKACEPVSQPNSGNNRPKDSFFFSKGASWLVETGHSLGAGYECEGNLNVSASYIYKFNPFFYAGGGTGIYYFYESSEVSIPFFIHARTNFLKKVKTPYLDVKLGVSTVYDTDAFFSLSAGYQFTNRKSRMMNLGLEYSYHYCHEIGFKYGIWF